MSMWIREHKKIIAVVVILVPATVYVLSAIPFLPIGGNNDWAGFWGGYLGAIIGALVAIYVMRKTLENEKNRRKEEEKERFLTEICELVAEYCAQTNQSNCHLLRYHQTGEDKWNYEALYTKCEATKLENILQIKLLSSKAHSYSLSDKLLNLILKVGKITDHLHEITVNNFEELEKEADGVSEELSNLMELTYIFMSENEG